MNVFEYQKEVVQILNNSLDRNHLSHAYIFEGPKGSGTKEIAIYLAQKLLCLNNNSACGECENCIRVKNGTHTNVIIISPMGDTIRKDQIAGIIHEGQMTSVTDKNRIFIIEEADKLNIASANTLLKFLEEPYPNNYVVLLTTNANKLLDTIVSRTQLLRFKPINKEEIVNQLIKSNIEKDYAYILSELYGNVEDAMAAYKEESVNNAIDLFKKLVNAKQNNKDLYIEYYLNKKSLTIDDYNNLLNILIIYKRQEMKYVESKTLQYFDEYILNNNYDDVTTDKLVKQIELLNKASNELKSHVNVDLIFASLCQNL